MWIDVHCIVIRGTRKSAGKEKPCAIEAAQGSIARAVTRLLALIRHQQLGMRTMRPSRRHALRSGGEVVEAALDVVAAGERRVVVHHVIGHGHASGCARGRWPFRRTDGARNGAEAFADVRAAHASTRRTCVRTMHGGSAASRSARVIDATAQRVAGRIGIFALRQGGCRSLAACFARILRIGARAVRHNGRTVFVDQRRAARAARTTAARAARGGVTRATRRRRRRRARAGISAGVGFLATERQDRS